MTAPSYCESIPDGLSSLYVLSGDFSLGLTLHFTDSPKQIKNNLRCVTNSILNLNISDTNYRAKGEGWRHFNFNSPAILIKKYQLYICKKFIKWTLYKLLGSNLCTVSSLFNREICPNPDCVLISLRLGVKVISLCLLGAAIYLIRFWIIPDWAEAEHENKALLPEQKDQTNSQLGRFRQRFISTNTEEICK